MASWLLALLLRPLVLFILLVCITSPIKRAMQRHMRDGRLKRLLLLRLT
jgi:hypothetical protein